MRRRLLAVLMLPVHLGLTVAVLAMCARWMIERECEAV